MKRTGAGHTFLGAVLLLHLGLSLAYSVAVPLAEAPDELSHYDYCRIVAKERRLPAGTEAGEAFQPPLYYLLGAALTWPLPMDLEFARSNPAFHLTEPQAPKNLFIHGRAEAFPYRGSALAFHLLRAFSAALSTLTVWAVYRGLLALTDGDRVVALGGAGFLAFLPEFSFLGGTVQNDNLTAALAALLLWRLLLTLRGRDTWREWALVGGLLGLALLTKLSLLAFVPLVVLVAAYRTWAARASGRASVAAAGAHLALALAVAAALSVWWYARNLRLYGDPLGWGLVTRAVDVRRCPLTWGDARWMLGGLSESFWGRFGGAAHIRLPLWGYALAWAFSGIALLGAIRGAVRVWSRPPRREAFIRWGFLFLWLGMVAAALARYTLTALGTNQARLLYPALLPLVAVLWLGALQWVPARWWGRVGLFISGVLLVANILVLALYLPSFYRAPAAGADQAVPSAPLATFGGQIALLEARLEPHGPEAWHEADVTLVWRALADVEEDVRISLWVQGPGGVPPWEVKGAPAGGRSPTDLWRASQVVRDRYPLALPPDAPLGEYRLYLGLQEFRSGEWWELDVPLPPDGPGHRMFLASWRYSPCLFQTLPEGVPHRVRAEFGGQVALVGYQVREVWHPLLPSVQALEVTLYWQALGGSRDDLVLFVHLLDAEGKYVAGHDQVPYGGTFPTSQWPEGAVVLDRHVVPLAEACPGRVYVPEVGAYPAPMGPRLPVTGGEDRVLLAPVRIGPPAY